jgi:hypothetical protein
LSALPLMCRTAILAIALVALTAGGAFAAPVSAPGSTSESAPAKLHQKTISPTTALATRHPASAHRRQYAAPTHTRPQTRASISRRPTSRQTGRAAGLAIRRELDQQQAARRNIALHVNPSPAASYPENEHARHLVHATSAMEDASASPVFLLQPAPAEGAEQREASPRNHTRAATPAPAPSLNDGGSTNEEMDSAETPVANTEEASLRAPFGASPTSLRGSHESLERQNTRLDAEGLERIEDESDLVDRIARKVLVPLPASSALTVNPELAATHRYCRPWTALFLADFSRAHAAAFHRPLEVSSAVRTMEYQKRLMRTNGNAAPAEGDVVSPHLTGATVDIAKDGLSRSEMAWMRTRLLALEAAGKIDVEEEFRQACFHITVYKNYAPLHTPLPASQAGGGSSRTRRHKAADPSVAVAAQGL